MRVAEILSKKWFVGSQVVESFSTGLPKPEMVSAIADEMLRIGAFVEHGTSLGEFLDAWEEDPWWDDDLDTDEILASEQFKIGFRQWLQHRYDYVTSLLKTQLKDGFPITISRGMIVSDEWLKSLKPGTSIGVFWALPGYDPNPYQARQQGHEIVLVASCTSPMVDWVETLRSRMDYLNGDTEGEIRLKKGVEIPLEEIEGSPYPFSPGVYLA